MPALAHRFSAMGAVTAFWTAYVITRPLGASFADWMALGHTRDGLGLGLAPVTLASTVAITGFVGYLATHSATRAPPPQPERSGRAKRGGAWFRGPR
jgi:uncharacterized membrane-anchored protein